MHRHDLAAHTHEHGFGLERRRPAESRTLVVVVLTAVTMVLEVAAGIAFGSMALLADGIHMASHATALGLGVLVYVLTRRLAHDPRLAFGSGKLNALGGYSSAVLLALFALYMAWESVARLVSPVPIQFDLAILVAFVGLAVNAVSIVLLNVGHDHRHPHDDDATLGHAHGDHNLRGAFLHVVTDALTSVLAVFALLTGKYLGAVWLDPAMGIVGAVVIIWWAVGLLRQSGAVLLDRQAPESLREEIRRRIEAIGDSQIADLHVWSVGPALFAAEVVVVSHDPAEPDVYRDKLAGLDLAHVIIEPRLCPGDVC